MNEIVVRASDVAALQLGASGWETLRPMLAKGARPLGHDIGPGHAFLAADVTQQYAGKLRDVKRSFVLLASGALVTFDVVVSPDPPAPVKWRLEGADNPAVVKTILPRRAGVRTVGNAVEVSPDKLSSETLFLQVIQLREPKPVVEIDSIEAAGVRLGDRVVVFYADSRMSISTVSFDVDGPGTLKILVTGLAPGAWEIWWAGGLENPDAVVNPQAGALYFEGKPGGYFLRRRSF